MVLQAETTVQYEFMSGHELGKHVQSKCLLISSSHIVTLMFELVFISKIRKVSNLSMRFVSCLQLVYTE